MSQGHTLTGHRGTVDVILENSERLWHGIIKALMTLPTKGLHFCICCCTYEILLFSIFVMVLSPM